MRCLWFFGLVGWILTSIFLTGVHTFNGSPSLQSSSRTMKISLSKGKIPSNQLLTEANMSHKASGNFKKRRRYSNTLNQIDSRNRRQWNRVTWHPSSIEDNYESLENNLEFPGTSCSLSVSKSRPNVLLLSSKPFEDRWIKWLNTNRQNFSNDADFETCKFILRRLITSIKQIQNFYNEKFLHENDGNGNEGDVFTDNIDIYNAVARGNNGDNDSRNDKHCNNNKKNNDNDNNIKNKARKTKESVTEENQRKDQNSEHRYAIVQDLRMLQNTFGLIPLQCMYETVAAASCIEVDFEKNNFNFPNNEKKERNIKRRSNRLGTKEEGGGEEIKENKKKQIIKGKGEVQIKVLRQERGELALVKDKRYEEMQRDRDSIKTSWNNTLNVLHDMIYISNYKPRVMTYYSIMKTCMLFHQYDETIAIYDTMVKANFKPTEESFALALNAYSSKINALLFEFSSEKRGKDLPLMTVENEEKKVNILQDTVIKAINIVKDRMESGLSLSSRIVETLMHILDENMSYLYKTTAKIRRSSFNSDVTNRNYKNGSDSSEVENARRSLQQKMLALQTEMEELFCLCLSPKFAYNLRATPSFMSWLLQLYDKRGITNKSTLITLVKTFKRSKRRRHNIENYKILIRVCLRFPHTSIKFNQARYVIQLLNKDFDTKSIEDQKRQESNKLQTFVNGNANANVNVNLNVNATTASTDDLDIDERQKAKLYEDNIHTDVDIHVDSQPNSNRNKDKNIRGKSDNNTIIGSKSGSDSDTLSFPSSFDLTLVRKQKQLLYNLLLKACASNYKLLLNIKEEMEENGVTPDLISYNTILSKLAEKGDWKNAFQVLQNIRVASLEPDLITYTTIMSTCIRGKQYEKALSVLSIIKMPPDAAIYSVALEACRYTSHHNENAKNISSSILQTIQREENEHMWLEPKLWSSVFRACGNILTSEQIYDRVQRIISSKHIVPSSKDKEKNRKTIEISHHPVGVDVALQHYHYGYSKYIDKRDCKYLFTSAIKGFSLNKKNDKGEVRNFVFKLLYQMKELEIDVDTILYGTILSILAKQGNYQDALQVLNEIPPKERNKLHYTMAIRACNNYLSDATTAKENKITQSRNSFSSSSSPFSLSYDDIMRLFVEMLKFDIEPDLVCMHSVLYKCSDIVLALKIFHYMLYDLKLMPDISTITTILHIDSKENDKESDKSLIQDYIFNWSIKEGLVFNEKVHYLDTLYERDISHLSYAMVQPALRYILRQIYLQKIQGQTGGQTGTTKEEEEEETTAQNKNLKSDSNTNANVDANANAIAGQQVQGTHANANINEGQKVEGIYANANVGQHANGSREVKSEIKKETDLDTNMKNINKNKNKNKKIENNLILITGVGHSSIRKLVLKTLKDWGFPMEEKDKDNEETDIMSLSEKNDDIKYVDFSKGIITINKDSLNTWIRENSHNLIREADSKEIAKQFSLQHRESFF